ncbi:MAG: Crp/Fnr family transcriptional regulator [Sulfuricaulis sp.]
MNNPYGLPQNRLLSILPGDEQQTLSPHLELVLLKFGQVLQESGSELTCAYFPVTSIISLHHILKDGSSTEIGIVGNEGFVGLSHFMGGYSTTHRAVVQCAGYAYRLPGQILKKESDRSISLQHLLLRYTQARITQMAQTVLCTRYHEVEQQLCRWLLSMFDRLHSDSLILTQEMIANMLGVRREGITEAVGKLEGAGLIHHRRGRIQIKDRARLEARACECYREVRNEFDRLLPAEQPVSEKHKITKP